MATLLTLAGDDGPLTAIHVPLRRGRQPERSFYGCPEFMTALRNDLPNWTTGILNAAQTPTEQMDSLLSRWISGREMEYGRRFRVMRPVRDQVWEMKSLDLRIFGWIYRPRVFIAAVLGYTDWYKGRAPAHSYDAARGRVLETRDALDLDQPKFTAGELHALV